MIKRLLFSFCLLILLVTGSGNAEEDAVLKLDYKAFSIGFQGLSMDEVYGNTLLFSFTNQTAEPMMVSVDYVLLDGVLVETFFADLVEPGATNSQKIVVESAAQYMQNWVLTEVVADLWVYSADNLYDSDIFHGEVVFLPQGKDAVQRWTRTPKNTDIVVLDSYLARMTVINATKGAGATLRLAFLTSGMTERSLSIRIQKIWINDTAIDVYYTSRLVRESIFFSTLEIPGGLDVLLNIPGGNRIRMSVEIIERDGQSARLLKRENVAFSM